MADVSGTEAKIELHKPAAGQETVTSVTGGCTFRLAFDPQSCSLEFHGNDLLWTFDDNSRIVLQDFIPHASKENIYLELEDGVVILGLDLLQTMTQMDEFEPGTLAAVDGAAPSGEAGCGIREEEHGGAPLPLGVLLDASPELVFPVADSGAPVGAPAHPAFSSEDHATGHEDTSAEALVFWLSHFSG